MFFKMIPLVFRYLGDYATANKELLHLIVSTIDANQVFVMTFYISNIQLCSLTCSSFLGEMQLFGSTEVESVLGINCLCNL